MEDFFIALHQLSGHIFGMRQSLGLQLELFFSFLDWKMFRWIVFGRITVGQHVERGSGKCMSMELGDDMGKGRATGSRQIATALLG